MSDSQTKDCLDPWFLPFVQPNGDVWPCCWFHESLGSISEQPFHEIMNGASFKELRKELLSGELRAACQNCPTRGSTSTKLLRDRLRQIKAAGQCNISAAGVK